MKARLFRTKLEFPPILRRGRSLKSSLNTIFIYVALLGQLAVTVRSVNANPTTESPKPAWAETLKPPKRMGSVCFIGESTNEKDRNQAMADAYKNALLNVIEREFPALISIKTRSSERLEGSTYSRDTAYMSDRVKFNGLIEDSESPFIETRAEKRGFTAYRLLCWQEALIKKEKERQALLLKGELVSPSNEVDSLLPPNAKTGLTGELEILTVPTGASIFLASSPIGHSNSLFKKVVEGQYEVVVHKAGFEVETRKVNIVPGKRTTERIELRRVTSEITINSIPKGATVYIDNKPEAQKTPMTVRQAVGSEFAIRVEMNDYHAEQRTIVATESPRVEEIKLKPQSGTLSVLSSPLGATISLNGKEIGKTPATGLRVEGGRYELTLKLVGFEDVSENVEVWKSQPKLFNAKLNPIQREHKSISLAAKSQGQIAYEEYKRGNFENAARLFQKSCEDGEGKACRNLGVMSQNGEGVQEELMDSRQWFGRGCLLKDADSCFALADSYHEHEPRNIDVAKIYFKKACELNSIEACANFGLLVVTKESTSSERYTARKFLDKACHANIAGSCYYLGSMLFNGLGGPTDRRKSRNFFLKSCRLGYEEACKYTE